jgi:hypothetical protein
VDLIQRQLEETAQEGVHPLGAKALGQWCGVRNVAKEDRHLLALALEGARQIQDLLGQVLGGVGAEGGEVPLRGWSVRAEGLAASAAELLARLVREVAGGAGNGQ